MAPARAPKRARLFARMTRGNGSDVFRIDLERESVLSFRDAARYVGSLKGGRRVSLQTLWRWSTRGCRGAMLETICVGGARCTSKEALQRFFDQLTESRAPGRADSPSAGASTVAVDSVPGDVDEVLRRAGIEERVEQ